MAVLGVLLTWSVGRRSPARSSTTATEKSTGSRKAKAATKCEEEITNPMAADDTVVGGDSWMQQTLGSDKSQDILKGNSSLNFVSMF